MDDYCESLNRERITSENEKMGVSASLESPPLADMGIKGSLSVRMERKGYLAGIKTTWGEC